MAKKVQAQETEWKMCIATQAIQQQMHEQLFSQTSTQRPKVS